MTAKTSFGQWLKKRRKMQDISQADLAQQVGCAAATLYKIETDERRPSRQIAALLAEHLNIPLDERAAFISFARTGTFDSLAAWGTPFRPPTNLHAEPTSLIGRDEDVSVLLKRLHQSRLLTLVGPPGIGKTRLSLQVAAQTLDDFADGVFFVALAAITDANLMSTTIANTLGIPNVGPRTPQERLQVYLGDKEILLVLDNFEQILAAAPQIAKLLAVCPLLKLLITSRSPLRIRQERQFPVSPLALPDVAHLPDIETVIDYSAVTLFMERAQAVKPDFSLTPENTPTVAAICNRLDGLPLAIELISARVKLLSPAALLERLHGRLMLQSDGLRDIEPRHRTLNAAIEWSYQLLNVEEQTLFRRLGVFVGGWTLDAVEVVCMDGLKIDLVDGLASLLDKNLVQRDLRSGNYPRFLLLETIREYVLELLISSGELEFLQQQHASYFVRLAETVAPDLTGGAQQGSEWDRLEIELPNLRAALAWSRAITNSEVGLRLSVGLGEFWAHRGHLDEGSKWISDTLTWVEQSIRSEALNTPYRQLRAKAHSRLAQFAAWRGDIKTTLPHIMESVTLFRELVDRPSLADSLSMYGVMLIQQDDYEHALAPLEESLSLSRELGNADLMAQCLLFLGNLAYSQGRSEQAGRIWGQSLDLLRSIGSTTWLIATLLAQLGMVAMDQGDYDLARIHLIESLTLLRALDERWQIFHTLEIFACLMASQEYQMADMQLGLVRSAHLFGAVEKLRETFAAPPVLSFHRHYHEHHVAILRNRLDELTFAAAWAEGRLMTLQAVLDYALSEG